VPGSQIDPAGYWDRILISRIKLQSLLRGIRGSWLAWDNERGDIDFKVPETFLLREATETRPAEKGLSVFFRSRVSDPKLLVDSFLVAFVPIKLDALRSEGLWVDPKPDNHSSGEICGVPLPSVDLERAEKIAYFLARAAQGRWEVRPSQNLIDKARRKWEEKQRRQRSD
jgi:hypothetical protein